MHIPSTESTRQGKILTNGHCALTRHGRLTPSTNNRIIRSQENTANQGEKIQLEKPATGATVITTLD
ncbi:hypothetical protein RRG08_029807 [Elysia crispata]|uniref:Uncharacterized protein n=1 Tax=Elysia crispata TaxID=231223 RepID=A0AAE0YLW4_9GAST|nr:hypothetical protein RRG08_029807 [Elysia crispata]